MNDMVDAQAAFQAGKKAAFEANKLSKRLHRQVGQAIGDFNMIEPGDKVITSSYESFGDMDRLVLK